MLRYSLLFLFFYSTIFAQDAKNYSVMIETTLDLSGKAPAINISWQNDDLATKYIVSRREYEVGDFEKLIELSGAANRFADLNIESGIIYEYEVEKQFFYNDEIISARAYKAFSLNTDLVENEMRTLLIIVDHSLSKKIETNLMTYISVLETEGWNVIVKNAPRIETYNPKAVLSVKNMVKAIKENEEDLESVLILGRVAVPYSGNIAPDGHGDSDPLPHKGAYPTDSYYADLDLNSWTDTSVVNEVSAFDRQHNIVNDGKWDQSYIPGEVELSIGRVDFYNMSFFQNSEATLINDYLVRNVGYRTVRLNADNEAILFDGFVDWKQGFAADGFNNLSALYGRNNLVEREVRSELRNNSYEFIYACASGGLDNIYNAIYSEDIAKDGYQGIHNMVFGSYNCDWDSPNNLLRGILASKPMGLTAVWGTRPFWTFYKLGLGETFGEVLMSTQNNRKEYRYPSVAYNGGVHIALMGDPTLKLINKDVLDESTFLYEKNEISGINIRIKNDESIWGYFLLLRNKASDKYEIVVRKEFEELKLGEFIISANTIPNKEEYDLNTLIIRPTIEVSGLSGIFKYSGIGMRGK